MLFLFPILTIIAVAALSNAINIIDGFNGLASGNVVLMAFAISYLGYQNGDILVMQIAMLFAASVAGFFLVNFPKGMLFLGDAGAYLNGYILGVMAILLVERNDEITPLVLLVIFAYPIMNCCFRFIEKPFVKGTVLISQIKFIFICWSIVAMRVTGHKRRFIRIPYGGLMLSFSALALFYVLFFPSYKSCRIIVFCLFYLSIYIFISECH